MAKCRTTKSWTGYEFSKDQYVEIEESERKQAPTKSERAINIEKFVPLEAIEPIYLEGRSYYLRPAGAAAEKPYGVLYAGMESEKCCAVAEFALSGHDQVVAVRPEAGLLVMYLLRFESQLKPRAEFSGDLPKAKPRADELELARTLIEGSFSSELDMSEYEDKYTERMKEIINRRWKASECEPACRRRRTIDDQLDGCPAPEHSTKQARPQTS